jgi:hypothetical protein
MIRRSCWSRCLSCTAAVFVRLGSVRLGPVRLAGSWQTRKSSISVDIVVTEGKARGTLVLLA